MRIITYQYAYIAGSADLCAEHAEAPPDWLPRLGAVSHGEHDGECVCCAHGDEMTEELSGQ